ncbi:MAG TPA: hypothetical protein VNC22_19155 [Sporichthya sp.]|nr:hypothetical protein [Sporichthya sp.]
MGVIKRFAIWSMVLGTLAIGGGASALAFEGGSTAGTAGTAGTADTADTAGNAAGAEGTSAPAVTEPITAAPAATDEVPLVSDVPSDAAAAAAATLMRWAAPHTAPSGS